MDQVNFIGDLVTGLTKDLKRLITYLSNRGKPESEEEDTNKKKEYEDPDEDECNS